MTTLSKMIEAALKSPDKYQVKWDEPTQAIKPVGSDNFTANICCTMTIDDCICTSRYLAFKQGHHIMSSDTVLLEEFMIVHWAYIEEM